MDSAAVVKLVVENRDDVLKDGLGDDGRRQRNQARNQAGEDNGTIVRLPALPKHELQ